MEPLFFPEDEQSLLPHELHPAQEDFDSTSNPEAGRVEQYNEGSGEDKDRPIGGGGGGDHGGGSGGQDEIQHHGQRRGKLEYDRHSVHVVTQYYIPDDPSRAREVRTNLSSWIGVFGAIAMRSSNARCGLHLIPRRGQVDRAGSQRWLSSRSFAHETPTRHLNRVSGKLSVAPLTPLARHCYVVLLFLRARSTRACCTTSGTGLWGRCTSSSITTTRCD